MLTSSLSLVQWKCFKKATLTTRVCQQSAHPCQQLAHPCQQSAPLSTIIIMKQLFSTIFLWCVGLCFFNLASAKNAETRKVVRQMMEDQGYKFYGFSYEHGSYNIT